MHSTAPEARLAKRVLSEADKFSPIPQPRLTIEYVPIDALHVAPNNPRVHPPAQVRAIARSIEVGGFNAPILVDKDNRIVAGHGRLAAAKLLVLTEVPIVRLEHLNKAQVQAYRLADNKLAERSTWDDQKVAIILKELAEATLDFNIEITGFERPEIDLLIQSLEPPEESDPNDDVEVSDGPAISREGDLWSLERHRLLCGSALNARAYGTVMGSERAAGVFTDPPYNLPLDSYLTGKGHKKHRDFAMATGEMSQEEFTKFLSESFRLMTSYCADTAIA